MDAMFPPGRSVYTFTPSKGKPLSAAARSAAVASATAAPREPGPRSPAAHGLPEPVPTVDFPVGDSAGDAAVTVAAPAIVDPQLPPPMLSPPSLPPSWLGLNPTAGTFVPSFSGAGGFSVLPAPNGVVAVAPTLAAGGGSVPAGCFVADASRVDVPQTFVHFGQHPSEGYGIFDPNMPILHLPPAFMTWPGSYAPMFSHVWGATPQLHPGPWPQGPLAGPGASMTPPVAEAAAERERAGQGGGGGGDVGHCRSTATGAINEDTATTDVPAPLRPSPPPEPTVSAPMSADPAGPVLPEPVPIVDVDAPAVTPGHDSRPATPITAAAEIDKTETSEEVESPSRIDLEMAGKCFYEVMGLGRSASAAEIRAAYRKLARKWHPDKNRGSEESNNMFQLIGEAHTILSDPEKRSGYDTHGRAGGDDPGDASDVGDLFRDLFAGHFGGGGNGGNGTHGGLFEGFGGHAGFFDDVGASGGGGGGGGAGGRRRGRRHGRGGRGGGGGIGDFATTTTSTTTRGENGEVITTTVTTDRGGTHEAVTVSGIGGGSATSHPRAPSKKQKRKRKRKGAKS